MKYKSSIIIYRVGNTYRWFAHGVTPRYGIGYYNGDQGSCWEDGVTESDIIIMYFLSRMSHYFHSAVHWMVRYKRKQ